MSLHLTPQPVQHPKCSVMILRTLTSSAESHHFKSQEPSCLKIHFWLRRFNSQARSSSCLLKKVGVRGEMELSFACGYWHGKEQRPHSSSYPAGLLQSSAFKTSHCPRRLCGTLMTPDKAFHQLLLSCLMGCEQSESAMCLFFFFKGISYSELVTCFFSWSFYPSRGGGRKDIL